MSEVINGTRQDFTVLNVDACGTENGSSVASIEVRQTGLVTFFNQNGDMSACTLNNGFKAGSWCSASDLGSSTNSCTAPIVRTTSSSVPKPSLTSLLTTSTCGCSKKKGNSE